MAALGTAGGVVVSTARCVPRHHHISSGETNHLVRNRCFMVSGKCVSINKQKFGDKKNLA